MFCAASFTPVGYEPRSRRVGETIRPWFDGKVSQAAQYFQEKILKHFYRGHEIVIETDKKSKQIVYDVFRNRQYVLAGFSYTNETEVLDRLKVKIQELLSQL